jgi:hypothetical protein
MSQCMSEAVLQLTFGVSVAEVCRAVREAATASSLTGDQQLVAATEQETILLVQGTKHLVSGKT